MSGDSLGPVIGIAMVALALPLALPLLIAPRRLTSFLLFGLLIAALSLASLSANDLVFLVAWELIALAAWGLGRLNARPGGAAAFPLGSAGLFGTTSLLAAIALRLPELDALRDPVWVTALAALAGLLAAVGLVMPIADRPPGARLDAVPAILVGPAALALGVLPVARLATVPAPRLALLGLGALSIAFLLAACRRDDVWSLLSDLALGVLCALLASHAAGERPTALLTVGVAIGAAIGLSSLALSLAEIIRRSGESEIARLGGHIADSPLLALGAASAGFLLVASLGTLGAAVGPRNVGLAREIGVIAPLLPALGAALATGHLLGGLFGGEPRARLIARHSRLAGSLLMLFALLAGAGLLALPGLLAAAGAAGG